jgi:uncharacterized protein (DUF433 family)
MTQLAVVEPLKAPIATDADGVCRVAGTRVRLETIINAYQLGCSPEEIVCKYPALSLSDVYSVIAYYLQQRETVDAYLSERNALIERTDREIEAQFPAAEIRARLLARRKSAAP